MRRRALPSLPGVLLAGLAACTPPHVGGVAGKDPPTTGTTGGGTGGATEDTAPTTAASQPTETTTDPGASTISAGTSGTGDDPLVPPAILDLDLGPDPLLHNIPIAVSVATAHAAGVRMQLDGDAAIELSAEGDDSFTGEIVLYSALENGKHSATFIAWRDGLESAPKEVQFTVALPPRGSKLFWSADDEPGAGRVVALAVTPPPHRLIELGTYVAAGQSRCYLRRRSLGGSWGPGDLVDLHPDILCNSIDLAVDDDGALYVLLHKLDNGEQRWWLGKIDVWGAEPAHIGTGSTDDLATALARDGERLVVCGAHLHDEGRDAAAWLFGPGEPGQFLGFDYPVVEDGPSIIRETAHDCELRGDRLILTGEAAGQFGPGFVEHIRHFYLHLDVPSPPPYHWRVADPDPQPQSAGQALALDDGGRALTVGYACGDQCDPQAELRLFSGAGEQIWRRPLDAALAFPHALVWHPAGYAIYATTRDAGTASAALFAEAWFPLEIAPLWSFAHPDPFVLQSAHTLAVGPHGQIYVGGTTASGYPLVACIAP